MTKPITSRALSSEKYLVCKYFKLNADNDDESTKDQIVQLLRTLSEKSSDYLEMKSDSSSIMPSMFSWAKIDYNNSDGKTTSKEELEEEELGEDILIEHFNYLSKVNTDIAECQIECYTRLLDGYKNYHENNEDRGTKRKERASEKRKDEVDLISFYYDKWDLKELQNFYDSSLDDDEW